MTLPRMEAIARRWETVPPLSVTAAQLASSLGLKVGAPKYEDLGGLVGELGGIPGFAVEMNLG